MFILPMFLYLFIFIFSGRPMSNEFSETTVRIFTKLSGLVELDKFCIHLAIEGTLL